MKKLFGHKRDRYEEEIDDLEFDDAYADEYTGEEYGAEDEEFYGDEEEYYAEEDIIEDDGIPADDEMYYADEDETEEYYADEDGTEDYYADEEYDAAEDAIAEDEEVYYADEDDDLEYADDEYDDGNGKERKGFFQGLWQKILNMSMMDRVVTVTGVAVLVLALVVGAVYFSASAADQQVSAFDSVGEQLAGITMIGEKGLSAVADAELAKLNAANVVEEEQEEESKEYEESEYVKEVSVVMKLTSIQKDLKVKFVNKKTDKLVGNVPFSIKVTGPDGKSEVWTDDDKDGVIYKKGIAGGDYTVEMEPLEGEKYADYKLSGDAKKITVKDKIAYEKVDVSDEVKKESEVDAKKEDTAQKETEVESELKDTVAWVETTQNMTYVAVPKSEVKDPATASVGTRFYRLAGEAVIGGGAAVESGKTLQLSAALAESYIADGWQLDAAQGKWSVDNTAAAGVDGTGLLTAGKVTQEQKVTVTYAGVMTRQQTVSGSEAVTETQNITGTTVITVTTAAITTLQLDKNTAGIAVGGTVKLTASTTPAGGALQWASDKPEIATVAQDGTVTGVKEGNAVITVTCGTLSAKCTVTVSGLMSLDKTTATVLVGGETPITVKPADDGKGTVTAASANTNVLTVSVKDKVVTLKGVAAGTTAITVTYTTASGIKASQDVAVNVVLNTNKLTNSKGETLYVLGADGKYTEAVAADYYKYDTFYIQTMRYTGWNTINGNVYFYDVNGKYVTGEQVIQGAKYNFASDGSLITGNGAFGIDVSKWNGTIDWNAVKNSGVSYVIIRCGYRGSSQGALIEDPKFKNNIKGATAAGLKVGVYFFSQAIDEVEAVEEASMVLGLIKGYKISYPVFLDVEGSGGRADNIDADTRTKVIKAFCQTIQNSGYTAGVYANKNWLEKKMDATQLTKYKIWLAQYAAAPTYTRTKYDMWQYKSTGKVSGISGNVDLNLSYLGY